MDKKYSIYDNLPKFIVNSSQLITKTIFDTNGDELLLMTETYKNEKNTTYTLSQISHYTKYPYDELKIYLKGLKYDAISLIIKLLTFWMDLNEVVYISNLCLSTNLYKQSFYLMFENNPKSFFDKLELNGNKVLIVRNICKDKIKIFENKGFKRIISRHINICDPNILNKKQKKQNACDLKLLEKLLQNKKYRLKSWKAKLNLPNVEVSKYTEVYKLLKDFRYCYKKLYHEKYSSYNPDYTEEWINVFLNLDNVGFVWMEYLEDMNDTINDKNQEKKNIWKVIGIVGYYYNETMLTTPLFGYDTDHTIYQDNKYSLYRAMTTIIQLETYRLHLIGHRSGGCKNFKKNRGSVGKLEYSMVKYDNLKWTNINDVIKKLSWIFLHLITLFIEIFYKK